MDKEFKKMDEEFKATVHERICQLFESDEFCDIEFNLSNGSTTEKVKGHRLLFGIASPVFKAMMYGKLAEGDSITIEDVEPDAFKTMKEYLYTDKANFKTINHATSIYKTADKYDLQHLIKVAENYIVSNITTDNVLEVVETLKCHKNSKIENVCMNLIENETDEVIDSEKFVECSVDTLEKIVEKDNLKTSEINLFNAVDRWAKWNSTNQESPTEEVVRLLSPVINKLRFLCMTPEEFAEGPAHSKLLNKDERLDLMSYITLPGTVELPSRFTIKSTQRNPSVLERRQRKISVTWFIQNASEIGRAKIFWSNKFYFNDMMWRIKLYAHPTGEEKSVSLYFYLLRNEVPQDSHRSCKVNFEFILIAQKYGCSDYFLGSVGGREFSVSTPSCGWKGFIKLSEMLNSKRGFLKNNRIKIVAELTLVD